MSTPSPSAQDLGPIPRPVPEISNPERQMHEDFMREALAMANLALSTNETPVGCVFVHNRTIISRGMNATNRTLNGTRHAEFMALSSLLSGSIAEGAGVGKPFDQALFKEVDLYVTIEPCIMCASLLRQIGIRKVYFGAVNDRFGGTGGVLSVHEKGGDGLAGFEVSGGWLAEEAVGLLRRFYDGVNGRAPEPRIKKVKEAKVEDDSISEVRRDGGG